MAHPLSALQKLVGASPVVLELDLAHGILAARPDNPLQALQLVNATRVETLRATLRDAAGDDRVRGLIVHASAERFPLAILDEVTLEVARFAEHKPTACWSESFGELTPSLGLYAMATAAHEIWVQPTGTLSISGPEVQVVLLKGGLAKLGIEPQFGQRHEYKTAADQFAADEVTPANREMMTSIVESLVEEACGMIGARRGLEPEDVREAVEAAPLTPEEALERGLIDHIGYRDELYEHVLDEWAASPEHLAYVNRYALRPRLSRALAGPRRKRIGVVDVHGAIVTGRGNAGPGRRSVGADVVAEQLRHAADDEQVAAIVLDVNSPGGSAVASDTIHRAVLQASAAGTPVVATMGQYAASGGYYVSLGADEIVALPSTLTGSIGVVAGKLVTSGLYDKLGLVRESITADEGAAALSDARPMTDEEWARLEAWLDRVYDDFVRKAADGRAMSVDELEPLARGRVWTGVQALDLGLVDHVGGRGRAIERAASLANLEPDEFDVVPVGPRGMLARLRPAQSSAALAGVRRRAVTPEALFAGALERLGVAAPGVLTMPLQLRLR